MALTRKDFYVGQTVWLLPLNDYKWVGEDRVKDETPVKATVKTVGTKYITVTMNGWIEYKFDLNTHNNGLPFLHQAVNIGAVDYNLYLSKQDVLDASERERLISAHKKLFSMWGQIPCTVQQLRESAKALGIN